MKYFYIYTFVPCCILLPFVMGIIHLRKLKNYDYFLLVYITVSGLVNVTVSILAYNRINNLPIFHFFTIVEFILISLFFSQVYRNKGYSVLTYIVIGIFTLASVLNTIFIQDLYKFNTYSRSLEAVIIICYCIYYFYYRISQSEESTHSATWHVSGIFIYFSTSFIIFIMSNITLTIDKQFNWILWHIHASMVLVMYLFITRGFYIGKNRR